MKVTNLAIALLAAGTLAFTGCGKKDEDKAGEGDTTAETDQAGTEGGEGTATKPAEEKPAEGGATEADMEKAWKFQQDLAAAAATEGDCAAKAKAITSTIDDNAEMMAKMAKYKEDEAMTKKWEEQYGQKSEELMKKMMTEDLKDCMQDKEVQAAFQKLAAAPE